MHAWYSFYPSWRNERFIEPYLTRTPTMNNLHGNRRADHYATVLRYYFYYVFFYKYLHFFSTINHIALLKHDDKDYYSETLIDISNVKIPSLSTMNKWMIFVFVFIFKPSIITEEACYEKEYLGLTLILYSYNERLF